MSNWPDKFNQMNEETQNGVIKEQVLLRIKNKRERKISLYSLTFTS